MAEKCARSGPWPRVRASLRLWTAGLLFAAAHAAAVHGATTDAPVSGQLSDGALWAARMPPNWNGTLLLYSHGYQPQVRAPELAPPGTQDWLLAHGYALLASSYSKGGWALKEAVPDQLAALEAFTAKFGKPRRTLAWGESMGGLVTVALAERHPDRIDGALPECGSLAGSLGMLNEALDGAFAFKTLLAPASALRVVDTRDDAANAAQATAVLTAALRTPAGRARVALAAAFAQIPDWTERNAPPPPPADTDQELSQVAAAFVMGVFLPRAEIEQRAGGVVSWNTGVDYRQQLDRSGRRAWVTRWYQLAGLDLDKDLATLNATARIAADPSAVAYLGAHYVPDGDLKVPVFSIHTLGDGATVPTQQGAYIATVRAAGHGGNVAVGWVHRAGHCNFTPAEHISALETLIDRLDSGTWQASPQTLNERARTSGAGAAEFVAHDPAPFLRPTRGSPGKP